MKKRTFNIAFIFAIVGILAGAFYREFTKFIGYDGVTSMSLVHTHTIALGTIMLMLIGLSIKAFNVKEDQKLDRLITAYVISVIGNSGVMFTRGLFQAMGWEITKAIDASFSGIAGLAHILLTISLIWILNIIRKSVD